MIEVAVTVREKDGRSTPVRVAITQVLLAGYTGRDRSKVMEHIRELECLGVTPPERVPMIFVVRPELVTTAGRLVPSCAETSGEVEFYLLQSTEGLLVGVGSDHTDRKHETIDITASKEMCQKPISQDAWRYVDVQPHWDRIEIRSWVTDAHGRRLYQEGRLDAFLPIDELLDELRYAGHTDMTHHIVFCGTLPTRDGLVYGQRFEAELRDPLLHRVLTCSYEVVNQTTAGC
jgi:hypothetical protein